MFIQFQGCSTLALVNIDVIFRTVTTMTSNIAIYYIQTYTYIVRIT